MLYIAKVASRVEHLLFSHLEKIEQIKILFKEVVVDQTPEVKFLKWQTNIVSGSL